MEYTTKLETSLFDLWNEEEVSVDNIMEFLNDDATFRNFGDGLTMIIRSNMPDDCMLTEKEYLKKTAEEQGIFINRNTINNWFAGKRPKKGNQSREHMYQIAFSLKLNLEKTSDLFRKVYLDRPFNLRNINEFVYCYCIKNGFDYQRALSILNRIDDEEYRSDEFTEGTLYTTVIQNEMQNLSDDEEIIEYVLEHPHNFKINNRSAMNTVKSLLAKIVATREESTLLRKNISIDIKDRKHSYISREISKWNYCIDKENSILGKYKSLTSVETMLDIITTGFTRGNSKDYSGKSIFKNSSLPKEIVSRFPRKNSFSKEAEELSSEELRKMIILLFSYKFWFDSQYVYEDVGYSGIEEFQEQLDDLLTRSNLQLLYYGNPFDWLFLYCSMYEDPLDRFRDIIAECRDL